MAHTIPKKRTTARAKSARAARPQAPVAVSSDSVSSFASSKRDKRAIKHSTLLGRIERSSSASRIQKRQGQQRRPSKKLVANLESVADALSDLQADGDAGGTDAGINGSVKENVLGQQIKLQKKSLKSRPGAAKRREKVEREERRRFDANLAQMAAAPAIGGGGSKVEDRWAALKRHIAGTTEIKKEFVRPQD